MHKIGPTVSEGKDIFIKDETPVFGLCYLKVVSSKIDRAEIGINR